MTGQYRRNYFFYVGYGILLLLAYLIEFTPTNISFFGAHASPILILVIVISMFESDMCAAIFGLIAGMLTDINVQNGSGLHSLTYMLIALICSLLVEILIQNNILSLICLGGLMLFINSLIELFTKSKVDISAMTLYFNFYLKNAVCSLVFLIPVYLIFALIFGHSLRFKKPEGIVPKKLRKKNRASLTKRNY